jgi:hypothetical protein
MKSTPHTHVNPTTLFRIAEGCVDFEEQEKRFIEFDHLLS